MRQGALRTLRKAWTLPAWEARWGVYGEGCAGHTFAGGGGTHPSCPPPNPAPLPLPPPTPTCPLAAWPLCPAARKWFSHWCACPPCCARCAVPLQELLEVVDEVKGRFILTSDHGNADEMVQVRGFSCCLITA